MHRHLNLLLRGLPCRILPGAFQALQAEAVDGGNAVRLRQALWFGPAAYLSSCGLRESCIRMALSSICTGDWGERECAHDR